MICPKCGTSNNDPAYNCISCGLNFRASTSNPSSQVGNPYPIRSVSVAQQSVRSTVEYAGFWRRTGAFIIDILILIFANIIITLVVGTNSDLSIIGIIRAVIFGTLSLVMLWLYFALMERSRHQATLGKMALKIKIINLDGKRISFWRAILRALMKFVPLLIVFLGMILHYSISGYSEQKSVLWAGIFCVLLVVYCVMIIVSTKKQSIHDLIASTLVVKRNSELLSANPSNSTPSVYPNPGYPVTPDYSQGNVMSQVQPSTVIEPKTVFHRNAWLVLPDGSNIMLNEATTAFGRSDFEKSVSPNVLSLISRQHFSIRILNGKYFLEDTGSSNGTRINDQEIRGKGQQELRDGYRISVAEVLNLVYKTE